MAARGRYHRVRPYGLQGWGPPYVLDRRLRRLQPYITEEWWRDPKTGLWRPVLSGGSLTFEQTPRPIFGTLGAGGLGGQQTTALNDNYTFGSAGAAIASRTSFRGARTISSIRFFVTAIAADSTVHWEVRTGSNTAPSSTLLASGNIAITAASGAGWKTISGLSVAVSAGYNWIILRGQLGNNITVLNSHTAGALSSNQDAFAHMVATTTNGWSTTTLANRRASLVIQTTDGTLRGLPFSDLVASNNTTNRRGMVLGGLSGPISLAGVVTDVAVANVNGIELIAGDTPPGGAILKSSDILVSAQGGTVGAIFDSPPILARGTKYRLVFTYAASATIPRKCVIGTGADDILRALKFGGIQTYWAEAGASDWSNDDVDAFPAMTLLLDDIIPVGRLHSVT